MKAIFRNLGSRTFAVKTLSVAALVACGGLGMNDVMATTSSSTFTVTATVINNCVISTVNIAFGNYDPTSATGVTAQGAVNTRCTQGDIVSVALSQGANPSVGTSTAAVPARQMISGASLLPYHIYIASSGSTEWGTGTVGINEPAPQASVSNAVPLVFTTYGAILAGVNVPAGSYTDTVTATVTF